jgi:hypothetical protein
MNGERYHEEESMQVSSFRPDTSLIGASQVDFMPKATNDWLFPRSELEHTPSVEDGISLQDELSARSKACSMIFAVGMLMKLYVACRMLSRKMTDGYV